MQLTTYWTRPNQEEPQWRYDLEKPAHVALIALGLAAVTPLPLLTTVIVAAAGYFGIGKLLVSAEIIPHGAHKPLGAEAVHWIGEIALCAVPVALVVATQHRLALAGVSVLVLLYLAVVLVTPEHP